jgi:hypothetical protein
MKKHIFTIIICILTVSISLGQNSNEVPNLKDLITWSGMPYSKFQAEMLKFQYTFNEENEDFWTKQTSYIYLRKTLQGDSLVTEKVIYKPGKDGSASIQVYFLKDIFTLYSNQLSTNNFKKTDCKFEADENVKQSCYSNDLYYLMLSNRMQPSENGKSSNSYSAFIYKI